MEAIRESARTTVGMPAVGTAPKRTTVAHIRGWARCQFRRLFCRRSGVEHKLQRLCSATTGIIDLERLGQLITGEIRTAMGISSAGLLLREEPLHHLRLVAAGGIDESAAGVYWQADHPILRWLNENRRILAREEMDRYPQFQALESQERADLDRMAAELFIPLHVKEDLVGVLVVGPKSSHLPYCADEKAALAAVANRTGVTIDNARLYDQAVREKSTAQVVLHETCAGIVVLDERWRVVSMNPGAELITGYSARDALSRRIDQVFGEETIASGSLLLRATQTGEKVPPAVTTLRGKQGSKAVLLGVTPVSSIGRSGLHYLLSLADVSRLKEVDRLKSDVVANVSHELRAPLASIKVYTELLLDAGDETDAKVRREWLSILDQKTDLMTGLVTEFLDLSRLESGHIELTRTPLKVDRVIMDVVELLRGQADRRQINIELEAPPGLSRLLADEDLITIIVKNLIGNAIKFSHEGGNVSISVTQDSEGTSFSVKDEGIGIPREAIPRIFTRFFRVSSDASARVEGTGLGLVLAKEAVIAHGGRIEVESVLGEGSRFTVTLPTT